MRKQVESDHSLRQARYAVYHLLTSHYRLYLTFFLLLADLGGELLHGDGDGGVYVHDGRELRQLELTVDGHRELGDDVSCNR